MKASTIYLVTIIFIALLAPFFLVERAQGMNFAHCLEAPSWTHPFGTDSLGRDLLARVLLGSTASLGVGVGAVLLSLLLGTILGAMAGYYGGWQDRCLMALVDIFLCFPTFFLILAVVAILGPGIFNILWIIGLTSWMGTARLVRAQVLSLREREFILASRALGASSAWLMTRHLIPNAMGPVIVSGILGISSAILVESGLSFLGIGVQPPMPSWGNILMDGKATLGVAWWLSFFPGLMIFLTVFAAHEVGEKLLEKSSS